jgi:RHS repeat-associated protein
MNRLLTQVPGGALAFRGTLSEAATVTVGGKPATVTAGNEFSGTAAVPAGTSQVTVQATDPSGNVRTNVYEVTQTGATKTFTYDLNGNLTGDGVKTYEWDAANRLVAVKQGGSTLASFTYDGNGRRATKTAGGTTTTYVYDGAQFLEERPSAGATKRHVYGPGIDQPLAQVQGGTTTYSVADHLGSVVRATDAAGAATLTREYDPWGNPLQGSATSGFAFTGREWDAEVQLAYYRARYYDSTAGRFLGEDPAGRIDGANLYRYVLNNSLRSRDPSGLITTKGCDLLQEKELGLAAQKAEAAAARGCCLPKGQDAQAWVNKIRTAVYHCGGVGGICAWAADPLGKITGRDMTFYDDAFNIWNLRTSNEPCGCLQAVVLHETSHLMGFSDDGSPSSYDIARRCFSCAGPGPQ